MAPSISPSTIQPLVRNSQIALIRRSSTEGHALVPRKLKAWERGFGDVLKVLREKEEHAEKQHRGLWEYGDLRDD
jgi:hypothetical protein